MKILLALGESMPRQGDVEAAATTISRVASEHEALITHAYAPAVAHALELALRNALPERDVVSVLTQIVIAPEAPSPEPHAIAEIRSLRFLLGSGALVICAGGNSAPVALDGPGTMHELEAEVDPNLTAALLARRLDADLLMIATDPRRVPGSDEAREMAARRFVEATGRRAAIGSLAKMIEVLRGGTLAA